MNKPLTYSTSARKKLIGGIYALISIFCVSIAMGVGASFYWDNDSGNDRWSNPANWVGDVLPGNNDDIFFEDDYGTGAEIVDLRANRTVRSVNFDNPTAYTLEKRRFDFEAITGAISINVNDLNGSPVSPITHTIDSDIRFSAELTITNVTTDVTLALNQDVDGQNSGAISIEGGGTVLLESKSKVKNVPTININDGTLSLAKKNRIDNDVAINLGGGTFDTGGFDERVDTLTLSASSTIELGGSTSVLEFANSSAETWSSGAILSINGWDGSATGGGSDQVIFRTNASSLTAGQLSQIRFLNPTGFAPGTYTAKILTNGEIVPDILAVPEPSTVIIGSLLVLVGLGDVYRRYRKSKADKEDASDEANA